MWLGAILTSILFIGGKFIIGYYLDTESFSDAYGTASSLVVLLAWVYYSVLILLLGAQFTYTYNRLIGRRIQPDSGAVEVVLKEVESNSQITSSEEKIPRERR